MQRHHRNAASRVGLATLIVGIALSLMAFGMSPAQAAPPAAAATSSATTQTAPTPTGRPCGPGVNLRTAERCAVTGPQQFSEGGCGFMQRCLYFSRGEQLIIIAGGSAAIIAAICSSTLGVGCAIASALVGGAFQWLSNRGGACPTSKPRLRVRYFPLPAAYACVS